MTKWYLRSRLFFRKWWARFLRAVSWVGKKLQVDAEHLLLKCKIRNLEYELRTAKERCDQVDAALNGFVNKINVKDGDVLVFTVPQSSIGHAFGCGWGALSYLRQEIANNTGHNISIIASTKEGGTIDVRTLDPLGRAKLKEILNKL